MIRNLPGSDENIVAIIPARGGSKGITKKNLYPVDGKPLVAYSIETACAAKLIDRVIVSTDDFKIAEIAKKYGAETPYLRPKEISDDRSTIDTAVSHLINFLHNEGYNLFACAILYPTHPFRSVELIDFLLGKLLNECDRVTTVKKINVSQLSFFVSNHESMKPLFSRKLLNENSPNTCYRPYGLLDAFVVKHRELPSFYHVIEDPSFLVDIDTLDDVRYAEAILKNNLFHRA